MTTDPTTNGHSARSHGSGRRPSRAGGPSLQGSTTPSHSLASAQRVAQPTGIVQGARKAGSRFCIDRIGGHRSIPYASGWSRPTHRRATWPVSRASPCRSPASTPCPGSTGERNRQPAHRESERDAETQRPSARDPVKRTARQTTDGAARFEGSFRGYRSERRPLCRALSCNAPGGRISVLEKRWTVTLRAPQAEAVYTFDRTHPRSRALGASHPRRAIVSARALKAIQRTGRSPDLLAWAEPATASRILRRNRMGLAPAEERSFLWPGPRALEEQAPHGLLP
jgi:hypothetical protein